MSFFIRVVAANKSVNKSAITTRLDDWRVTDVVERHILAKWPILQHFRPGNLLVGVLFLCRDVVGVFYSPADCV